MFFKKNILEYSSSIMMRIKLKKLQHLDLMQLGEGFAAAAIAPATFTPVKIPLCFFKSSKNKQESPCISLSVIDSAKQNSFL